MSALSPVPAVDEIAAGVWSIRVPMPQHPLRASFCYVYAEKDGSATIIDPGWPTEQSWDELTSSLRSIGIDPARTSAILLTHAHRDHSGLAGRLASASSATVALHADDHALINRDEAQHRARVREWLSLVGAGDDFGAPAPGGTDLPRLPEKVTPDTVLRDGDVISLPSGELTVHWTPGHTPGHVCFEDRARGLLFSGDHLLPRITPNISSMVGHRESALGDYLKSLQRIGTLAVSRVLPGHEYAFSDHATRIDEITAHHRERLDEIVDLLASGPWWSTHDVARELRWSRPWGQITGIQRRAALGEVLSHLHFLDLAAVVQKTRGATPQIWSLRHPEALDGAWKGAGFAKPVSRS